MKLAKVKCNNCGTELEAPEGQSAVFCSECGAKIAVPTPVTVGAPAPETAPAAETPAAPAPAKKKNGITKIIIIAAAAIVAIAALAAVFFIVIKPGMDYNAAVQLKEDKNYDEAIEAFTKLGGYKDSRAQLDEAYLLKAIKQAESGKFDKAVKTLKNIEDDDVDLTAFSEAANAKLAEMIAEGDQYSVKEAIEALGSYAQDTDEAIAEGITALLENGDYYGAYGALYALGDVAEDTSAVRGVITGHFTSLVDADKDSEATDMYYALSEYIDDVSGILNKKVAGLLDAGNYTRAREIVQYVYWSVEEPAGAVTEKAKALADAGDIDKALEVAAVVEGYSEYSEIRYDIASKLLDSGDYDRAEEIFDDLGWYSDSYDKANEARQLKALAIVDKENKTAEDYIEAYNAIRYADGLEDTRDALVFQWAKDAIDNADTELADALADNVYFSDNALEKVYDLVIENLPSTAEVDEDAGVTANYDLIAVMQSIVGNMSYYYNDVSTLRDYLTDLSEGDSFSASTVSKLWEVDGMTDILSSELGISGVLVGSWSTEDGEYSINMSESWSGGFTLGYELPIGERPEEAASWIVKNRDIIWVDGDGNELGAALKVRVLDFDSIRVYCYSTNTAIEMTRQ